MPKKGKAKGWGPSSVWTHWKNTRGPKGRNEVRITSKGRIALGEELLHDVSEVHFNVYFSTDKIIIVPALTKEARRTSYVVTLPAGATGYLGCQKWILKHKIRPGVYPAKVSGSGVITIRDILRWSPGGRGEKT